MLPIIFLSCGTKMSPLLMLTLSYLRGVLASPTSVHTLSPRLSITPRDGIVDAILNTPNGQRSAVDILLSCLSTMIACTWVSAHPNIPPREGKREFRVLCRLGLVLTTMVAPEWVLLYAMREWYGARKLAKELRLKGYQWTITHGYFAQMGGFLLYDGTEKIGILDHWNLHALFVEERTLLLSGREISKNEVTIPDISLDELQDRSKGDGLSKAIAVMQSTWFVVQLVARWVQHLTVTKLELFTLGFAIFNGIIYFMWWDKPLDVRFAVPMVLKKGYQDEATQTGSTDIGNIAISSSRRLSIEKESTLFPDDFEAEKHVLVLPFEDKGEIGYSYEDQTNKSVIETLVPAPHWQLEGILETAKSLVLVTVSHIINRRRIPITSRELHVAWREYNLAGASYMRVSLGDAYIDSHDDLYIHAISSIPCLIFGGIHCIAWNFGFPTVVELNLWRACAAAITILPVATNIASCCYFPRRPPPSYKSATFREAAFPSPWKFLYALPATVHIIIYIIARVGLFLEALLTLRDLSPSSLSQVNWTTLLPHI